MGCSGSKASEASRRENAFDPTTLILENPGRIQNFYSVEVKLGEGAHGSVCRARNKNSNILRAVRSVAKAQFKSPEPIKREIDILRQMDHPNIVKLHETYEDHRNVYMVIDLCEGGELFDSIIKAGHLSEAQAANLIQQVVGAVSYMHDNRVCHRDIRPDSFLFERPEALENGQLKLVDFGSACVFDPSRPMTTRVGSSYYVSPQVLAGKYDRACDLWSCGVVAYMMLCGYPPFFGETEGEVLAKVRAGNFSFKPSDWKSVSDDAKGLICGLLKMSARDRLTAEQALDHEWIKNRAPKAPSVSLPSNFVDNLRSFRSQNRLKKAALHVIAGQLDQDQIKDLRQVFQMLDSNNDGLLSGWELKQALLRAGLTDIPPDLQQILDDVDADGSGIVDYTEFLAATLDKRLYIQEDVCWSAFRLFDRNGDGRISHDEIKFVLNNGDISKLMGAKSIEDLLGVVDTSGDGMIDFDEFMAMMVHTASR